MWMMIVQYRAVLLLSHSELSYKICNFGLSSDRKEHKMNSYMEKLYLCTVLCCHPMM